MTTRNLARYAYVGGVRQSPPRPHDEVGFSRCAVPTSAFTGCSFPCVNDDTYAAYSASVIFGTLSFFALPCLLIPLSVLYFFCKSMPLFPSFYSNQKRIQMRLPLPSLTMRDTVRRSFLRSSIGTPPFFPASSSLIKARRDLPKIFVSHTSPSS